MTCAEFQAQLPELIGSGANLADNEHLRSCELCRALLADLETIAEAARQLFPVVDPSDKLWDQIEIAIRSEGGGSEEKGEALKNDR
jgi:hypothetical protein